MRKKRLILAILSAMTLISGCKTDQTKDKSGSKMSQKEWSYRVIPLPQEMKVTDSITVPPAKIKFTPLIGNALQIKTINNLFSKLTKGISGNKIAVNITSGLVSDKNIQVADDIKKRLSSLPNNDQAYAITSERKHGVLNITLTANTYTGLLYAARTLSQLLKLPEQLTAETKIEVPEINIIDWPDIGERGQWGNAAHTSMDWFSKWKLNLIEYQYHPKVDTKGKPVVPDYSEMINKADSLGIKLIVCIPHINIITRGALAAAPYKKSMKQFLPVFLRDKNGKITEYPDFTDPLTLKLLTNWLMQIAQQTHKSHKEISVWLSEGGVPSKLKTKTGRKASYVLECEAIKKAFDKVKEKYPDLKLRLWNSQGSRVLGENDAIINFARKNDCGFFYYDGHYTYISDKKPMIFPSLTKMSTEGGWVGCVPQITNSWRTIVPTTSPQFVKFRTKEFTDKKLACILGYTVPNRFFYDYNLTAMAEWAWNANGRNEEDFSRAYAEINGICAPDLFAEWAVKNGKISWEIAASNLIICLVHDPAMGFYGSVPFDYTYGGSSKLHDIPNLEKVIHTARETVKLAEKAGNKNMINESKFNLAALEAFKVLKTTSKILRTEKITDNEKKQLSSLMDELDHLAPQVKENTIEWAERCAYNQTGKKGAYFGQRVLEAANALFRTCDTLRTVSACLLLPDPRPETRLHDVGEWTAKDFSRGRAKINFDVSKLISRKGGQYNVCFDFLEGKLFVMISHINLVEISKDKKRKVIAKSPDAYGGAWPRVGGNTTCMECRLNVPATKKNTKLILEIELAVHTPGRQFPETFPKKEQVCRGLVALRRVYNADELPEKNISTVNSPGLKDVAAQKKMKLLKKGNTVQVGVTKGLGTNGIISVLNKQKGIKAFALSKINQENLMKCNVLIVTQVKNPISLIRNANLVAEWVSAGGGVIFLHDAVGYRKHMAMFKQIGSGVTHPKVNKVKVVNIHPITQNLEKGKFFSPGFQFDHVVLKTGPDGKEIIVSEEGRPVVTAGKLNKGKVILNGMLTGLKGDKKDTGGVEAEPEGKELTLLINSVNWLAKQ